MTKCVFWAQYVRGRTVVIVHFQANAGWEDHSCKRTKWSISKTAGCLQSVCVHVCAVSQKWASSQYLVSSTVISLLSVFTGLFLIS